MSSKQSKRYYEAEFRVWVEEPDPKEKPACGDLWNGEWDHGKGPRPRCFRPEGHEGEHHDTRKADTGEAWLDYYWGREPEAARVEFRQSGSPPSD